MIRILENKKIGHADLLSGFFAITPERIKDDLEILGATMTDLKALERSFCQIKVPTLDVAVEALHRRMLLAVGMARFSTLPADLRLFYTTLTAHEIAELACTVSAGKGQLAELAKMMGDTGSCGDCKHCKEDVFLSDTLLEGVHDSVFHEVTGRYGLGSFATIFEENRPMYHIRCEVGRRLITPSRIDREEHSVDVSKIRTLYGPEFEQEYVRRLEKHQLGPA